MDQILKIIAHNATLISIIISVVALIQSYKQIKLSNKQNLFNERLKNYLLVQSLIDLYRNNRDHILKIKREAIYFACDFDFTGLINNSYLESMGDAIKRPLQPIQQKDFLRKIEEINQEAERVEFIYDKKEAKQLSKFVSLYSKYLMESYRYIVLLQSMEEIRSTDIQKRDVHNIAATVGEEKERKELFKILDDLDDIYNKLVKNKVMKKIRKQIKLI